MKNTVTITIITRVTAGVLTTLVTATGFLWLDMAVAQEPDEVGEVIECESEGVYIKRNEFGSFLCFDNLQCGDMDFSDFCVRI